MSKTDFNSLFGDSTIDFKCPSCNHKVKVSLKQLGTVVKCPHCSVNIELEKDAGYNKATKDVDKSLKDFEKSLNNLFK